MRSWLMMNLVDVLAGFDEQLTLNRLGVSPLTTLNVSSVVDGLFIISHARNFKVWNPGSSSGML